MYGTPEELPPKFGILYGVASREPTKLTVDPKGPYLLRDMDVLRIPVGRTEPPCDRFS